MTPFAAHGANQTGTVRYRRQRFPKTLIPDSNDLAYKRGAPKRREADINYQWVTGNSGWIRLQDGGAALWRWREAPFNGAFGLPRLIASNWS